MPRIRTFTDGVQVGDVTVTPSAADVDAQKEDQLDRLEGAVLQGLFNHENRIRALESKAALTPAQFRAVVKALL